jgi:hypothetical protein
MTEEIDMYETIAKNNLYMSIFSKGLQVILYIDHRKYWDFKWKVLGHAETV